MLRFHTLQVADIRPDAEDAVAISLMGSEDIRGEYEGLPGQHIVLRQQIAGQEVRRTYSLVSTPGTWPLQIVARIHPQGLMSGYLADALRVGDSIDALPPNGSLTPRPAFKDRRTFVAFASGCGITPVMSVAASVLAMDSRNRFILFYGNRNSARTMCLEDLQALKDRNLGRFSVHFVMSQEPQEVELYNGRLDGERVMRMARTLFAPREVSEYFVCGPGTMIDDVSATLKELGVERDRIHGEHFTVAGPAVAVAAPAVTPDAVVAGSARGSAEVALETAVADLSPDQAEVTILMDGRRRTFTMKMNDEKVLDAAERAGVDLPFSCRAGVCSTCRTRVVKGHVKMDENYALEEWELAEGYVLACQSRVQTPVLELDYDEK
jgi:ring-1,2-phenylacetyl-CoA epoxidase subunit PaaE